MDIASKLLFSKVSHRRLFPKENRFSYRVYSLVFDPEKIDELADGRWFGVDRWGLFSFHRKDHGNCDGSSLTEWAKGVVNRYGVDLGVKRFVLIAMPRVLGYGFNPVSFWLCLDEEDALKAVIAEVHNTFGERHLYFCRNKDGTAIESNDAIEAEKMFHVSPFMERSGHYRFKYNLSDRGFSAVINYYDLEGRKKLLTSMAGTFSDNSRRQQLSAFIRCPLVTLKTVAMIHWQAAKLALKGIRYVPKPPQLNDSYNSESKD